MFSELVKNVMNLGIITEDDVRRLTAIELMLLIIERSNGLLEYLKSYIQSNDARVEQLDKKYQQITDEIKQRLIDNETYFNEVIRENLIDIAIEQLNNWLTDGTLERVITETALKFGVIINPTDEVQTRLNQLESKVTVKFAKGTYNIGQPYKIVDKSDITFDLSDATFIQSKHGYCAFELSNCSNIKIIGGKIIGAGKFYPQTIDNVAKLLVNEKVGRNSDWGESKDDDKSSSKTPYNGGFLTNVGFGILLIEGNNNIIISGTECRDFNYVGIGIGYRGKIDGEVNKNITVKDCYCHDNFSAGIHFMHVDGFVATGNKCENNGHPDASRDDFDCDPGYGISCRNSESRPVNGVISNNICKGNKRKGIDVHSGNHILIEGNVVEDCYRWGIALTRFNGAVDNIQVVDNTVRTSAYKKGGAGILCDSGGYNVIDGNKIYGSGLEANSIYCLNTNARVSNNVIVDSSTTGDDAHAILVWDSEVDFIGNTLSNSGSKSCMRIFPKDAGVVNIKNNRIKHETNVAKIFTNVSSPDHHVTVNLVGNSISGNESESIDFQAFKNASGIIDDNVFNGHVYLDDTCDYNIGICNKGFKSKEKKAKTLPIGTITSTCVVTIVDGVISFEDNNHVVTDVTSHANGLTIHVGDRLIKGISWMYNGTDTQEVTDVRLRGIYSNNSADFSLYKTDGTPFGNPSTDFTKSSLVFIISVI